MIQFISQGDTPTDHIRSIQQALSGGCRWIQLRMKGAPEEEVFDVAREVKELCKQHNATFIVNDNPYIAKAIEASGVHLGKNDLSPSEARQLLGSGSIIGGTANEWDDVEHLVGQGVDYIGLGPFRFTTTKTNLAPLIGLEGYRETICKAQAAGYQLPIVAIGGITIDDLPDLLATGVHGIAVSGCVAQAPDPIETMKQLTNQLRIWTN